MAYRTGGIRQDQNGIAITVLHYRPYHYAVTGCCSLVPQLLPAPTVKPDFAAGQSPAQRFFIHVSQHQHGTSIGILNYRRDKPFFVEFYILYQPFTFSYLTDGVNSLFQVNISGIKRLADNGTLSPELPQHPEVV